MNDELLALAAALEEEQGMDWLAALLLAQELMPDLTRAAREWDTAAMLAGNTALNVTNN